MSSFVFITGPCLTCKNIFSYHPNKVPSVRVNGVREAVCKTCIDAANIKRREIGMTDLTYADDAYEGCPEAEVNWNDH